MGTQASSASCVHPEVSTVESVSPPHCSVGCTAIELFTQLILCLCIASSVHLTAFLTSPKSWGCGPEDEAEANLKYITNVTMFCSPRPGQSRR